MHEPSLEPSLPRSSCLLLFATAIRAVAAAVAAAAAAAAIAATRSGVFVEPL